jgi:Uma2 family endonuclease
MDISRYERFTDGFERRIELIGGYLLSCNHADGNKALLSLLLESWGAESVLAFADPSLWWQSLQIASSTHPRLSAPKTPLAPGSLWKHNRLRQKLDLDLFAAAPDAAHVYGRDLVMKLGENAPTPDLFIATPLLNTPMSDYYLGGPADIVIEVIAETKDVTRFDNQRVLYLNYGVREVWSFHVATGETLVYSRDKAQRAKEHLVSQAVPELSVNLETLFSDARESCVTWQRSWTSTEVTRARGVSFGDLPFVPRVSLEPEPITFDEFIAWAPESKLELLDGKIIASGHEGTRNLIGMLCMTLGAAETVSLLPHEAWVQALETYMPDYYEQERQNTLDKLRAFTQDVKAQLEVKQVFVKGDLLSPNRWTFWSHLEIIFPEQGREGMLHLYNMSRHYFRSLEVTLYGKDDDLNMLMAHAVEVT